MRPDELLALMRGNVVKTGLLKNTKVYGRTEKLQITEDAYATATYHDTACKVYNLKQAATGGFDAYVCDYGRNQINYQVLGNEADFCFTITMNGCTFGVGTPASDGSLLVSHGNLAELEGHRLDPVGNQAERQLAVGHQLHGEGASYLTPDMYRGDKANVTMFGIRVSGAWKFYYQRYAAAGGGTFKLLGLTELDTNTVTL
jgi:hypothetical protein